MEFEEEMHQQRKQLRKVIEQKLDDKAAREAAKKKKMLQLGRFRKSLRGALEAEVANSIKKKKAEEEEKAQKVYGNQSVIIFKPNGDRKFKTGSNWFGKEAPKVTEMVKTLDKDGHWRTGSADAVTESWQTKGKIE